MGGALVTPTCAGTRRVGVTSRLPRADAAPNLHPQLPASGPDPATLQPSADRGTWRDGAQLPEARDTAPKGGERPPAASVRGREGHTRLPRRRTL